MNNKEIDYQFDLSFWSIYKKNGSDCFKRTQAKAYKTSQPASELSVLVTHLKSGTSNFSQNKFYFL